MEVQGKAPRSITETHLDGKQPEPGAGNPSAGDGESPWGCPGGSAPAGLELSQILHSARAGSSLSLLPVGNERQCLAPKFLCSLCPDKKKTAHRPNASCLQLTAMGARQGNPHTAQGYCTLQGLLQGTNSALSTSASTTAVGDTRCFCRERGTPAEPVGQEAPCPLGTSRQWPCTQPSVGTANNSLKCCHFQNTPEN